MTRPSLGTLGIGSAALAAALWAADAAPAAAQCATCATPTVAYSPVVVQPQTTVVRTGWYPGYLLDRLRLRRWSALDTTAAVAAAPTYSVGYAPTYTAAYAPTYTAAYAPATYTAGYTPYITAYAPLQTPVVQTSYAAPAVAAPACTSCAATTTVSYAPSTVYRPVEVAPVVQTVVADPCSACPTCPTGVSQAAYVEGAPVAAPADCPTCAPASSEPQYYSGSSTQPPAAPPGNGPVTPPPSLKPDVAAPQNGTYGSGAGAAEANQEQSVVPGPAEEEEGPEAEADPAAETDPAAFQAPPLLGPQNDRTANRPTVDVHNAVYRQPVRSAARVSTTAAKAAPKVDANGWYAVDR